TEEPFRTMLLVAMCLGLRCSEILGLRWSDIDWDGLTILVQRGVVAGHVDVVKTKYSNVRVPLDPSLAEALLSWKLRSRFNKMNVYGATMAETKREANSRVVRMVMGS